MAATQDFSSREINWMRRWRSQAHLRTRDGQRPSSTEEWNNLLARLSTEISNDAFKFSGLRWITRSNKPMLVTAHLEDTLVVRKINDNLRRAYGVRQPSRQSLIRTVVQALRENVPKTIVRVDLRKCFESIDRKRLMAELKADGLVSSQTIALLEELFRSAGKKNRQLLAWGIPRGLVVSNTLAELRLRSVDDALRAISENYLLLRYVDDILIFTRLPESEALSRVHKAVRDVGLKLNLAKCRTRRMACQCEVTCSHGSTCPCAKSCICSSLTGAHLQDIEYLGYRFDFSRFNEPKKQNSVYLHFSPKKSSRVKARVFSSIKSCEVTQDWALLERRMKFITGNQMLRNELGKRTLLSGLAFTHPDYKPGPSNTEGTLEDFDRFYRSQLRLLVRLKGTPPNLAELEKITFVSGYKERRRTKFTGVQVNEIKACWRA